jgi:hypothetical protein
MEIAAHSAAAIVRPPNGRAEEVPMDGKRARLAARRFDRATTTIPPAVQPTPDEPPPSPATARSRRTAQAAPRWQQGSDQLSDRWATILGIGWPLAIVAWMELSPTPADPNATDPLVIELAIRALFLCLIATAVAAGVRHRAAALGGVATGLIITTLTAACPASGHHTLGLWWFAQLGIVTAMLGVSAVALVHTRR